MDWGEREEGGTEGKRQTHGQNPYFPIKREGDCFYNNEA